MSKFKILFGLSGSIACFKACQVISMLVKDGHTVQTFCTKSALKFIGPATLEGLTGRSLAQDLWESPSAIGHIDLVKACDKIIVCPATANVINKFAHGMANDLMGSIFLSHDFKKPFLIAPAMNTAMYQHPVTQESIAKLTKLGVKVLPTDSGRLACGDEGEGRLLEPGLIYERILSA